MGKGCFIMLDLFPAGKIQLSAGKVVREYFVRYGLRFMVLAPPSPHP